MLTKNNHMKRFICVGLTTLVFLAGCSSRKAQQFKGDAELNFKIDKNFTDAVAQYKQMKALLPPGRFPKTYHPATARFETSGSEWWCSGFYPGTLLHLYEESKDTVLYNEAMRMLKLLEKEQFNKSTHDLGFMMFCSYGHANRLQPKPEYSDILINSAKSLSTRFNPKTGAIKSWDSKPSDFLVIIDNMMNLELLFWATRVTGDSSFHKIAVTHANTTTKNHFRPDYSSYHVVNYHPETGQIQQRRTAQGFADESAWARGQSWGLYGYTVMFRETKDKQYLDQAQRIADFLLNHPNLPADKIPYWDYNAPDIPKALRDASAGSIMASALLELSTYVGKKDRVRYFDAAETMLKTLSSDTYKAPAGTNGGFLLMHSVGHLPGKSEIDVPLTYADYYYVEAMRRYQSMTK
jgi:unsaturated chondroitin disaccharide hydrolase